MNKLIFAATFFVVVPTLYAQQSEPISETSQTSSQTAPQPVQQNSDPQSNLPASIRPGHPLDPADVDILTGKRDRELEASQAAVGAPVPVAMPGESGEYGRAFDVGLLPMTRIGSPFFFSRLQPRGFGRGGFGRARFRGSR